MIRAISICGLAVGFLLISPSLRGSVLHVLGGATLFLDQHSPWSYIVLVAVLGAGTIVSLSSTKPR
jgi:hypothetical protein